MPTREELAQRIYEAARVEDSRPAWGECGPFPRRVALAQADAALSALKGSRTGEELYIALTAACEATGALLRGPVWREASHQWQAAYNHVAATFAAPPIPEGWPEGLFLGGIEWLRCQSDHPLYGWCIQHINRMINNIPYTVATVHGATGEEAEHLARLTAWTIANQRPAARAVETPPPSDGISRHVYEDLKRDHAALLAAVDGPGGYREQISNLTARSESTIIARLNLTSHLTPTVLRALRPGLLSLLTESGEVSPEQVDEALDDRGKMAALLLRVRAPTPF